MLDQQLYDNAIAALKKGYKDEAKNGFAKVLSVNENHSLARAQIGQHHFNEGEYNDSEYHDCIAHYRLAIADDPHPQFFNNIGSAYIEADMWEHAERSYREAIARDPKLSMAYNNLGRLLLVRGRPDEAKATFKKAIEIFPDYIDAHIGLAFTHLELSEFEDGWSEYEWRKKKIPQNRYLPPEFVGQKIEPNEAIVLIGEQGLGDIIQFCRYAPLVKQRYGCRVYIEVQAPVLRLLDTLDGIDGLVGYGYPFPEDTKYSQMLLTCPLLFGHYSEDDFPRSQSYLKANAFRSRLFLPFMNDVPPGPKIGFCWSGSRGIPSVDKRRSTNLSMWTPLGVTEGVSWISLQKGDHATRELKQTRNGMRILNVIGECHDMADTAALIMHCDLVITVDSAVAHLAAALGKPTWILARRDTCWRWLRDRRDSPWYPTVRHYRQKNFNDWDGLMKDVAVDLRQWVDDRTPVLKEAA